MWLVIRQQYGITAVHSQISFRGEASDSIAKCQLFFQAIDWDNLFEPCRVFFSLLCLVSFSLVSLFG